MSNRFEAAAAMYSGRMRYSAHDVSEEKRDESGKWTEGGSSGKTEQIKKPSPYIDPEGKEFHANWTKKKNGRVEALMSAGWKKDENGVESDTPFVAEMQRMNKMYFDLDKNDPEQKLASQIEKTMGEGPYEFTFRNIHTEYGDQKDAFGVTGTGNAREVIAKASQCLVEFLNSYHSPKVVYYTSHQRSRTGMYDLLTRRVGAVSDYIGYRIEVPGSEVAMFAVVRNDSKENFEKIAKKNKMKATSYETRKADRYSRSEGLPVDEKNVTFATFDQIKTLAERVKAAAAQTHRTPSEAQKLAGNFVKGKFWWNGREIAIENPRGSVRSGTSKSGKQWAVRMAGHYGYIRRTKSEADGDHVDIFMGPHPESDLVCVIDQRNHEGKFDEHKAVAGCRSVQEAKQLYHDCYSAGWTGMKSITPMTRHQFFAWLDHGDTSKPIAGQVSKYSRWEEIKHPREHGRFAPKDMGEMNVWRAAGDDDIRIGHSFSPDRETAEAYLNNPGFGGENLYRQKLHVKNVLDLTDAQDDGAAWQALSDASGEHIDPQQYQYLISRAIPTSATLAENLARNGYHWVHFHDDFPEGAKTLIPVHADSVDALDGSMRKQKKRDEYSREGTPMTRYEQAAMLYSKGAEFNYEPSAKQMWGKLQQEAHKETGIIFDHENDEEVGNREIKAGDDDCQFLVELRSAGGDWQSPTYYFRVQIIDGMVNGHSKYSHPYFIVIPGPEDGNGNLIKGKDRSGKESDKWVPDEEIQRKSEDRRDEAKCWEFIKKTLDDMTSEPLKYSRFEQAAMLYSAKHKPSKDQESFKWITIGSHGEGKGGGVHVKIDGK